MKALQEQFDETVAKKDDLARQVDECATKLDRAQRLLGGLGGERIRWAEASEALGKQYTNITGDVLIASALGTTALAFVGLSAFALMTRKDFSFLSGFLVVGFFVLMGAVLLAWLFDLSGFHLAISCGFVLFACAAILWQTSAIIHGGETNYILATVTLYVQIYNLFISLLHIFGAFGED